MTLIIGWTRNVLAPQTKLNVVVYSFSGKLKGMTVSLTVSASIKKVRNLILIVVLFGTSECTQVSQRPTISLCRKRRERMEMWVSAWKEGPSTSSAFAHPRHARLLARFLDLLAWKMVRKHPAPQTSLQCERLWFWIFVQGHKLTVKIMLAVRQ